MASTDFPVAVIGMAVNLPAARTCNEFWSLLVDGKESVEHFPSNRANDVHHVVNAFSSELIDKENPFFFGSFFENVDKFDPSVFLISKQEALYIEPEQRILLETVWAVLEDAGYISKIRETKTGVYIGNTVNKYKYILTDDHPSIFHGNHFPSISARISYIFDLKGPARMVATGCSSSLLSVHLACQGLLSHDCDMAIAGGITLDLLPISAHVNIWNQLGTANFDAKCRPFDHSANSITKGEGCGAVMLKALARAIHDGDHIYGILEASTTNQDGHSNGNTAPHPGAQTSLLLEAWELAKITPEKICYLEAHRTGTELGDPIEISGIANAFKKCEQTFTCRSTQKIPLGSVKANVGHLGDGAAGIVGLIKALLCYKNHMIPPSIHFNKELDAHNNWAASPVFVNTHPINLVPSEESAPMYISVSAFGLLGTNVHIVVKNFNSNTTAQDVPCGEIHFMALAANSKWSLSELALKMCPYFTSEPTNANLKNVCYTINTGREQLRFKHRVIVYGSDWREMQQSLRSLHYSLSQENVRCDAGYVYNYEENNAEKIKMIMNVSEKGQLILPFISGKSIAWDQYYSNCDEVFKKIPQLPTYSFERVRYWPILSEPFSANLLALEHGTSLSDQKENWGGSNSRDVRVPFTEAAIEYTIQSALNDALNLQYDWREHAEENLFSHGLDTFLGTHINMIIKRELGCGFSINGFHLTPTYQGIKAMIQEELDSRSSGIEATARQSSAPTLNSPKAISIVHPHAKCIALSSSQQRMVIMQLTSPESSAYTETIAIKCTNLTLKPVEIFKTLVCLHPILMFRIKSEDSYLMQTDNKIEYNPDMIVVADLKAAEEALSISIPAMDILCESLVKFRCVKTVSDGIILAVHIHRVLADDITLTNLSHDLLELTNMGRNVLSSHPVEYDRAPSYTTFVDSEEAYIKSERYREDSQFWLLYFKSLPPAASFTILPENECVWSSCIPYKAKHKTLPMPAHDRKQMLSFCEHFGITPYHYFLACTIVVLHRYLSIDTVTLAVPVTMRTDVNEKADGMAANIVIFKATIDSSLTMGEHIKTISDNWSTVQNNSRYPFDQVVKMLWKEHGIDLKALCCTMFNYSSKCYMKEEIRVLSKHAKMPLSIDIMDSMNSCDLFVEWSPELISDIILESLANSLMKLYCTAFSNADQPIHCINLLSTSEKTLIRSFQSSEHVLPPVTTVINIFEDYAWFHPELVAVICEKNSLTYAQLNHLASNLAYELLSKVEKNTLKEQTVILLMSKDEYAVASILGVWKTGGHFLPIAMSNQLSLNDVLKCTTPAAIIINTPVDSIPVLQSTTNLLIVNIHDVPHVDNSKLTQGCRSVDDIAYVIRTSGSTGKPKQCNISQRSLHIMSNAWKLQYKMDEFDVSVLQWAPLSFDVFVGDLVRALISAPGKLVICPERYRLDIKHILNLISTNRISMSEVTPQFGFQLALSARKDDFDSLHFFILGSDVLQSHIYHKIRNLLRKDQRLVNSYGMTEATIDSSLYEGDVLPATRSGAVPIGRPLPGVTFHILDSETLQVCPVGTIGELYISGDILASGDPVVVQLKHVKEKALKTGDAAYWLPCGNVDLLGRLDNMVKLRGYRISTTEIENKLAQHVKGVKDVCITVNGHSKTKEFLCAFVVCEEDLDANIDRKRVRNQLSNYLPHYMLPDFVTVVENIPLTANGKVDYASLPSLSQLQKFQKISSSSLVVSPTISTLKTLFASSLGLPNCVHIDCDQTFLEQGANSLTLVQFSTMIATDTSFNIGITDIFSYPSINMLAEFVDAKSSEPKNDNFCTALRRATGEHIDQFDPVQKGNEDGKDENIIVMCTTKQQVYEELHDIWCKVLSISTIASDDSFSACGGESFLTIQMLNYVQKRLGCQLEIADIYGYPTLAMLAAHVAQILGVDDFINELSSSGSAQTLSTRSQCLETKTLLVFPGQDVQKQGKFQTMKDSPEARALFRKAESIIGYNILDLCIAGGKELEEKFESTEFVEVALLTGCIAKLEQIKKERPEKLQRITHVTGLSVGEFAALVFAEVISFEDALRLIQCRGHVMENEVNDSPTGIVNIIGPGADQLQGYLTTYFPDMRISIFLADNQHTVAGSSEDCDLLLHSLSNNEQNANDLNVIEARILRVAGAFHSPYMIQASAKVNPVIQSTHFSKPVLPVIMNVNGDVTTSVEKIKCFVQEQLVAPVKWRQSILTAYKLGIKNFIELSPGGVPTLIVKNRIAECSDSNVELIEI